MVVFDAADLDAEDFEAVVSEDDFEGAEEEDEGADEDLGALSACLPPMVSFRPGWISAGSAPTASRLSA